MGVIRLSPSKLEATRLYRLGFLDDEQMQQRLVGEAVQTDAMTIGRDIHSALENGQPAGLTTIEGLSLEFEERDSFDSVVIEREMWVSREFVVGVDVVKLLGKIDVLLPGVVVDYKTSNRSLDGWDHLQASWQWRCYLLMLDDPTFAEFLCRHYRYRFERKNKRIVVEPSNEATFYLDVTMDDLKDQIEDTVAIARGFGVEHLLLDDRPTEKQVNYARSLIRKRFTSRKALAARFGAEESAVKDGTRQWVKSLKKSRVSDMIEVLK